MQNQAVATTDRFTARGRRPDDRRPHHQGPAHRGRADEHDRGVRVGRTPTTSCSTRASPTSPPPATVRRDCTRTRRSSRRRTCTSSTRTRPSPTAAVDAGQLRRTPVRRSNRLDGQYIDTSQPIFTYYDCRRQRRLVRCRSRTTRDLRSIDAVGVTLRIRVHPNSPVVVISTRIHVRNVDYNPNN